MKSIETLKLNTPEISNEDVFNLSNSHSNSHYNPNPQGTYEQLNQLFNNQDSQEKAVQEAKDILGDSAKDLTDEQILELVNEMQYLVDSWLEEYEKKNLMGKL